MLKEGTRDRSANAQSSLSLPAPPFRNQPSAHVTPKPLKKPHRHEHLELSDGVVKRLQTRISLLALGVDARGPQELGVAGLSCGIRPGLRHCCLHAGSAHGWAAQGRKPGSGKQRPWPHTQAQSPWVRGGVRALGLQGGWAPARRTYFRAPGGLSGAWARCPLRSVFSLKPRPHLSGSPGTVGTGRQTRACLCAGSWGTASR